MTVDLNVADFPYGVDEDIDWEDDFKYRTDVLYAYYYRVDLRKDLFNEGPAPHLTYLTKRVRLTKTCDQWHHAQEFDGHRAEYRCTDEALYLIIDWSDGPNDVWVTKACTSHAIEATEQTGDWCEVRLMVDRPTRNV